MVICTSVCKPDKPGWWDLGLYSFWLRRTWAAGNTGLGRTSIWHFENPNPVRHPSIHKYSKSPVSIEIQEPVFFVSWNEPSNCFQISDCYTSGIAAIMTFYPLFCGRGSTRRQSLPGMVPIPSAIQLILKFTINHFILTPTNVYNYIYDKYDQIALLNLSNHRKIQRQTHN